MRTTTTTLAAMLLALGMMAGPATASPLDDPHPHVLLLGADVLEVAPSPGMPPYIVTGYDKCVDLAGGQTLRHNRFHTNVHFGRSGQALRGAGHIVVPFANCDTVNALPFVDVDG